MSRRAKTLANLGLNGLRKQHLSSALSPENPPEAMLLPPGRIQRLPACVENSARLCGEKGWACLLLTK